MERQSLSNKSEFEEAALKFELEKLRIDADKDVRIQAAQAMGNMFNKAQMQIFADPETMAKMSSQFMRAASLGAAADGLMQSLPAGSQEMLTKLASSVAQQLSPKAASAVAEHVNGNGDTTVVVDVKPVEKKSRT